MDYLHSFYEIKILSAWIQMNRIMIMIIFHNAIFIYLYTIFNVMIFYDTTMLSKPYIYNSVLYINTIYIYKIYITVF